MSNIIKPKRSNTAGLTPTTSNLSSGELGVNMADQKVYINNGTAVVQIGAGNLSGLDDVSITTPTSGQSLQYDGTNWVNSSAGTGDVVGASSSTDNALVRFDGTTGKLIQNGNITEDDNGNMSGILSQTFADGTAVTVSAGKMWYNGTTGSWNMGMGGGNITQQVGEETFIYGKASSAITEGQLIVKTGAVGASGVITFAPSPTGLTDNDGIIGVATENIALNGFGRITTFGVVHGINATGSSVGETWADGDQLYYNPNYVGGLTNVKPSAPYAKVAIATVTHNGSGGSGSIQVDIVYGSKLGSTDSNVQINGVASGNTLIYDAVAGYWKNANISAGTGVSVTNGAGSITIGNTGVTSAVAGTGISVSGATGAVTVTNTAPDQTVVLTAGTGISTSGTYPNFTISNTGVTSVGATAPIASSGGATPTISISQATTSTNGYLSSTDWNTFNGKAPAVTYTSNYIPYGQGTTTPALSANFTYNGTSLGVTSTNATNTIIVTDTGTSGANIKIAGNGATTPNKTIRAFNGNLGIVNNAYTAEIFTLSDSGALSVSGNVTANGTVLTGNTGTVTSVSGTAPVSVATGTTTPAISLASGYGDTQNPYASKTANYVLASPNGTAGVPTFRALVASDIPTLNQNTTGTASNITAYTINQNLGTSNSPSFDQVLSTNNGNGTNFKVGDDAWIGDINTANTIRVQGQQDATQGYIVFGNSNTTALGRSGTGALTYGGNTILNSSNYNSYSPTLTGGGASGSWGISVTGSAGSVANSLTAGTGLSGSTFNGSGAVTWTLATSGVTANTYGSSTAIPVITVDAYGRATSITTATVSGGQYFGTATTKAIAYNANSISENITVTAGNNGLSAGPITISTGFTVTVQTGANWVIV